MIGTTSTAASAPYNDESWEIWGVSSRAKYVTRATRWFELHRIDGEGAAWAAGWRKAMKIFSHDLELLMFYPEPELGPNVGAYPYEHIADRFGTFFMTSTFAWMMALAIDELRPRGGEPVDGEIGIWGVEMEYGTEYSLQRSGFRHFIDLAKDHGIAVTRLVSGGLSYEPVPYPLWQDDPLLNKLELRQLRVKKQLEKHDKSVRMTRSLIAQNVALMEEIKRFAAGGYDIEARLSSIEKETTALVETSSGLSKAIVADEGALEEQRWLKNYLSP